VSTNQIHLGDPAPSPPPLRTEKEIIARWTDQKPVVSVLCPTYNHGEFIDDAIRGFLGQETSFPFEVIIRDDASTDGTADIVREYESKYPKILRGIFESENRYKRGPARRRLRSFARGNFLAYCDGDDYWLSPNKLSRQVETLGSRDDCVVSHHQAVVIENGYVTSLAKLPEKSQRDFSFTELQEGAWLLTLSLVYRRVAIPQHPKAHRFANGDKYFTSRLGDYGGAAYEDDFIAAAYRRHSSSVWSSLDDVDRRITQATSFYYIASQYYQEGRTLLGNHWLEKSLREVRRPFMQHQS